MGHYCWVGAQYLRGIEYAQEAFGIATALQDPELRIMASYTLAGLQGARGEWRTAIGLHMRYLDGSDADLAKRRLGLVASGSPYIFGCGWLAFALEAVGDFEQAMRYADNAVRAAEAGDSAQAQAIAYTLRAGPPAWKGEFPQALPWVERAVHLCESKGLLLWLAPAYCTWGRFLAWSGRIAEGLSYLERGVTIWESIRARTFSSSFHVWWAEGLLLAGRMGDATRTAEKALELAVVSGERGVEAEARHVLGEILAAGTEPDLEMACNFYEQAKALSEELGMRPLLARCHLGLGQLHRRAGKQRQAQEHLARAAAMLREMDMRFWLEQAEAEMKE